MSRKYSQNFRFFFGYYEFHGEMEIVFFEPFITGCISSIVSSSSHDSKQKKCFTCPSCRNIIKYGQDGIKALPRNRNIESAIKR